MESVKEHTALIKKLVKASPKFKGNEDLLDDFCSETYQKSYLILQSVSDIDSLNAYMKKVVSSAIIDVLKNSGRLVRTTKGYSSVKEIHVSDYASEVKSVEISSKEETPVKKKRGRKKKSEVNNDNINDVPISNVAVIEQNIDDINLKDIPENIEISSLELEDSDENNIESISDFYPNQAPVLSKDLLYIKDPRESIEEQIIRKDILENIINLVKQINEEKPKDEFLKLFYSRYFLQMKQKEIAQDIEISQAEVSKRLVQLSQLIKEKLY